MTKQILNKTRPTYTYIYALYIQYEQHLLGLVKLPLDRTVHSHNCQHSCIVHVACFFMFMLQLLAATGCIRCQTTIIAFRAAGYQRLVASGYYTKLLADYCQLLSSCTYNHPACLLIMSFLSSALLAKYLCFPFVFCTYILIAVINLLMSLNYSHGCHIRLAFG